MIESEMVARTPERQTDEADAFRVEVHGVELARACTCCCKHRHNPRPAGKHCKRCKGH
jgi:hypothetical protein